METNIYSTTILTKKINLDFNEVGKEIEDNITKKLKHSFEGICIVDGYIKPKSIKLLTYSSGLVSSATISFDVVFECSICLPCEDSIISVYVKNITKAGIRAEIVNRDEPTPIVIFITRDYNYTAESIKVGDKILVKILGTRFELNDNYISAIAELVNQNTPDESPKEEDEEESSEKEEDEEESSEKEDKEESSEKEEDKEDEEDKEESSEKEEDKEESSEKEDKEESSEKEEDKEESSEKEEDKEDEEEDKEESSEKEEDKEDKEDEDEDKEEDQDKKK